MPFIHMPGIVGQVWVPDDDGSSPKKHNCPDCTSCQWCSDTRCEVCLKRKRRGSGKRSCRRQKP
jgi:hypothetical protein